MDWILGQWQVVPRGCVADVVEHGLDLEDWVGNALEVVGRKSMDLGLVRWTAVDVDFRADILGVDCLQSVVEMIGMIGMTDREQSEEPGSSQFPKLVY